jgi:pyridoxamine 5'-phosphate oxidase
MATWQDELRLDETELDPEPHRQFQRWLQEATDSGEPMANAAALATCSQNGLPSVRMVLVDEVDERGLTFQTNLESPKATDLAAVPRAAMTFFWARLLRQVRVSGPATPLTPAEVAAYYARMPRPVQAMIRACHQSQVVADRAELERIHGEAMRSIEDGPPAHWGGYRVSMDTIEFWQGRQNWLQDRLRYTRLPGAGWRIERLAP